MGDGVCGVPRGRARRWLHGWAREGAWKGRQAEGLQPGAAVGSALFLTACLSQASSTKWTTLSH